ncbi:MAG: ABC transporter permease [Alphaproteobacteria bacterium]
MRVDPYISGLQKDTVQQGFATKLAAFLSLVYALVVRDLRSEHKNAALGILISVAQPLVTGLVFFAFMSLIGGRAGKVRGDDLTFVLVGFILFFVHIRTVSAVSGALRPDMMNHQRLTPFLMVCVRATGSFYKNTLALIIMLAANYLLRDVIEMHDPLMFVFAFLLCWLGGIGIGIVFLAAGRYLSWGALLHTTYVRVMFFTSGKFFVANTVPGFIRPYLDWNPLFHLLDQGRAAAFLNYTSRTTNMSYPILVILATLVIGMLVENYVRINYSASQMPGG